VTVAIRTETAAQVASVARMLSRAGLVEAFGHVSARTEDGFLISSTDPLGAAGAEGVHALDRDGAASAGVSAVPLEAPLHAAVYAARSDVGAICRTHSRAMVAFGARAVAPPILHGLGGLCGEVHLSPHTDLIADPGSAREAAASLAQADCLLLRANGGLATGSDLGQAAVRAYYLEERCRVALDAGPGAGELSIAEVGARSRWSAAETERAWKWLQWRFGDAADRDLGRQLDEVERSQQHD
jgi:ribulose-5-phosphate 4-epimerase/fuculose-1-phosphate aldolase